MDVAYIEGSSWTNFVGGERSLGVVDGDFDMWWRDAHAVFLTAEAKALDWRVRELVIMPVDSLARED